VVQVTLTGGAEHPAKIVGFDEDRDVAVLQLIIEDGDLVSITPPVWYTKAAKLAVVDANQGVYAAAANLVMSKTESCFDQCQVVASFSKLPARAGCRGLSVVCDLCSRHSLLLCLPLPVHAGHYSVWDMHWLNRHC